ncbi:MAG: secretin N-terminal domain-containing protein [Xenococcus sp. MO_188.B8]|nr:secretin N-terminal domain-containing protein [Xenococcus sp. MO_188.B8]
MKVYSYSLGFLTGTAAILLANPLSLAATGQIEDVVLSPKKQGLELRLTTNSTEQESPSFVTIVEDNIVQTTILNTKLQLAPQEDFQQTNPARGIEQISINQIDEDNTQITLTSKSDITLEPTIDQQGKDLIFELNPTFKSRSFLSRIPFLSDLNSFTSKLPSFITAQAVKDYKKSTDNIDSKVSNNSTNRNNGDRNDVLIPNPEVIIGESTEGFDNSLPTEQNPDQPYLPRAVAPPVGDIAVSNISTFADTIDLGSNAMIPRLVLRDAPVREVLSLLSRQAGLNVVFAVSGDDEESRGDEGTVPEGPTISLDLENQTVQEAFDSIMLISGLNASRRGNIIYIGAKLPSQARNLISRTLRLNQVRAENAALFLASQGAQGQRLTTEVEEIIDPETNRVIQRKELPATLEDLGGPAEDEEDNTSALLLRGLQISTDDRLNSITLIGEPRKVETATAFLTQLDARRRQVAVNVKVIDVNLDNQDLFNSSFSFGVNDSFFIQDQGAATLRFGEASPAREIDINSPGGRVTNPPTIANPWAEANAFLDLDNIISIPNGSGGVINESGQVLTPRGAAEFFGFEADASHPFGAGITEFTPGTDGAITFNDDGTASFTAPELAEAEFSLPSLFQYPKKFLAILEAQVTSGNAKILTDPTLVVQEGQEATVKLAQNVIESVKTDIDGDSGTRTITPVIVEAGLVLKVNVERIDDNGFVGLSVSPTVSAIGATQIFESGDGASNELNLLSKRELSSGLIRLRDGQTLILSGIIQDQERSTVSKVPILGDIPLLGSLFRSSTKDNERAEVIVLLTPQVIDEQAEFGYDYTPGKETREMLRQGGLDLPNNP